MYVSLHWSTCLASLCLLPWRAWGQRNMHYCCVQAVFTIQCIFNHILVVQNYAIMLWLALKSHLKKPLNSSASQRLFDTGATLVSGSGSRWIRILFMFTLFGKSLILFCLNVANVSRPSWKSLNLQRRSVWLTLKVCQLCCSRLISTPDLHWTGAVTPCYCAEDKVKASEGTVTWLKTSEWISFCFYPLN